MGWFGGICGAGAPGGSNLWLLHDLLLKLNRWDQLKDDAVGRFLLQHQTLQTGCAGAAWASPFPLLFQNSISQVLAVTNTELLPLCPGVSDGHVRQSGTGLGDFSCFSRLPFFTTLLGDIYLLENLLLQLLFTADYFQRCLPFA